MFLSTVMTRSICTFIFVEFELHGDAKSLCCGGLCRFCRLCSKVGVNYYSPCWWTHSYCISAIQGGAGRLELCGNLGLGGGVTPSLGLLKAVQKALHAAGNNIPIMTMVRPRTGDFLYTNGEIDVMIEDIQIFKEHGVQGVVIGALTSDGRVDKERTKRLVDASFPLEICFHRAFDMTRDPEEALSDILNIGGITRILTSGQGKSAPASINVLQSLLKMAKARGKEGNTVVIVPGSGIDGKTVDAVLDSLLSLGLSEIHLSGGNWIEGGMDFRREGMGMGVGSSGEWGVWITNKEKITEVREKVNKRQNTVE
ncbi:hypothetical protein K435DRAFT_259329 [Dendrothele bispora CBS 962.96]|uniref:Copper homeostasis protein cutC homolog n=1 Tax=Dendrothele bispora (strain CBS 962.96) TaxID=1314807 RepID=A0A4S8MVZ7_DENBC|nr:hypothetical protein K435DRAFT_259329 [Dendrothele bispora CBS 962.96]